MNAAQQSGYKLVPDRDTDAQDYPNESPGTEIHLTEVEDLHQDLKAEWQEMSSEEQVVQILAGRAMRTLNDRSRLLITVQSDSVYGAALALPQIARTAGWSLEYTSLACHSMMFLLTNLVLQGFLLYMLSVEERTLAKFGGQMHLCDFGAQYNNCPDASNCVGPGGTIYSPDRMYNWGVWTTRVFVRDSFKSLFPDRAEEIEATIDPGEYGLESYYLRIVCCFLYVIGLWPDLAGSWDILSLLASVPTQSEPWIEPRPGWKEIVEKQAGTDDLGLDFVRFRVAGVPLHWKLIDFLLIFVPKMYIWVLTVDVGIVFLMETSQIEDMIVNCVALAFILSIDELTMTMLPSKTKSMLEMIEGGQFSTRTRLTLQEEALLHQNDKRWNLLSPSFYGIIIPARLLFLLAVTAFFIGNYYWEECQHLEDGSWVSQEIHRPLRAQLPFLSFLFEPFPGLFPVTVEEETAWTFHESR